MLPLRLMTLGAECSACERWPLQYREQLSTGILVTVPSVLSPGPPTPVSVQTSLVHSVLPLLEPRVSSCKQNFVLWPFKRLSVSPVLSPWQTEIMLLFTAVCYVGSFPALVLRLGSPAWGLDPTLLRGNHLATEISLQHFSYRMWESTQSSCFSATFHTSHIVV